MSNPHSRTTAVVRPLGSVPSASLRGTIIAIEGRRLTLDCSASLAPGAAIRVDSGDELFLGEVDGKDAQGNLTMTVEQTISSVSDLTRLMQALCGPVNNGMRDEPVSDAACTPVMRRQYRRMAAS